jgi:uncharacterized coiled-coil protein SlyX
MSPDELAERLARLEASVAHLDRLAEQLNEALIDQGRQLTRLHKRLDQLADAIHARDNESAPPPIERPPHYGR